MDYTIADLEQNRKIDELAHGLAELTQRVAAIEAELNTPATPPDPLKQILSELESKLRGIL